MEQMAINLNLRINDLLEEIYYMNVNLSNEIYTASKINEKQVFKALRHIEDKNKRCQMLIEMLKEYK